MKVAELICQGCGRVSSAPLLTDRMETMPRCYCGGTNQVVRVKAAAGLAAAHRAPQVESTQVLAAR